MTPKPVILVGDVGGPSTDLALADEKLTIRAIRTFASQVAKGRLEQVLEAIPARVVMSDRVGLLGAARAALSNRAARTESASSAAASPRTRVTM